MAKIKQVPAIEFRLLTNDHLRFDEECRMKGKKRTELAREAIIWYLDNQDKLTADAKETALEKRVRKMEERLAALMARTAIDVGMIYHLIYQNMNEETRKGDVAWAYNSAVVRLRTRLSGEAEGLKELIKPNDQDDSEAQVHKRAARKR